MRDFTRVFCPEIVNADRQARGQDAIDVTAVCLQVNIQRRQEDNDCNNMQEIAD